MAQRLWDRLHGFSLVEVAVTVDRIRTLNATIANKCRWRLRIKYGDVSCRPGRPSCPRWSNMLCRVVPLSYTLIRWWWVRFGGGAGSVHPTRSHSDVLGRSTDIKLTVEIRLKYCLTETTSYHFSKLGPPVVGRVIITSSHVESLCKLNQLFESCDNSRSNNW